MALTANLIRPATIDALIATIKHEYPHGHIRTTGRARTVRRQAQLMAQRIRANEHEFRQTYRDSHHIRQMVSWFRAHPGSTEESTTDAFESIIRQARASGAVVSNHLSDNARDISWPQGTAADLHAIRERITELGGHVIIEKDAAGGPHWHIDWAETPFRLP
jgi:hypothetical protein